MTSRGTPTRVLDLCGLASAAAYLWLAAESHAAPIPLPIYFALLAIAWAALLVAYRALPTAPSAFPLRRMVCWCLVFRAIGFAAEPILEDDHYRYLWDGHRFATTGTPYGDAPADHFDDATVPEPLQKILDGINHPDVPTLYPPASQGLFLVGYWIAPGDLAAVKLLLLLADLATLWLLLRLVPPRHALLYAWCPLLIQETAFTGHVDSLGVFFLVSALYADRKGWSGRAGGLAACAVATKAFALVLVPLLLVRSTRRGAVAFVATLCALYLPFLIGNGGSERMGLFTFATEWEFNSTGYALLAGLGGPFAARLAAVAGVATILLAATCRHARSPGWSVPRGEWVLGALFLLAPVVNPWYLLWMLPFACARPAPWIFAALAGVSLSYAHGLFLPGAGLPPYHHPAWVRPAEVLAILAAIAFAAARKVRESDPAASLRAGPPWQRDELAG